VTKICVLRAAGVNCNDEVAYGFEMAGATTSQIHVNQLLENPTLLDQFGGVAIPGGFSYGDDIAAGKVLALEVGGALSGGFQRLLDRGGIILGICNGFQALIKSGFLPGPENGGEPNLATLVENNSGHYEDRWVRLSVDSSRSVFFSDDEPIELPVGHAEGRFTVPSDGHMGRLEGDHRVVVRYTTGDGGEAGYPDNPNGSLGGVAGICDATGQVLGLMPHPDRFLFPWQHPHWSRGRRREHGDGLRIFENAVKALRT